MFRVIVAGSRDFNNYEFLKTTLDNLLINYNDAIIVCGMARGADALGDKYAQEKGYKVAYYPADWDLYDKKAGYIRNEIMAKNADACVVFWDGKSKGSKHMIDLAKKYNLKLRVINY
jgi:hypothetical protein